MRVARLLVKAVALIVPVSIRREWAEEWVGELQAAESGARGRLRTVRAMLALVPGVLFDAAATRRHWGDLARERRQGVGARTTDREAGMAGMRSDIEQVYKTLRKRPGYALVATGTLALGIGATTAMFSAVHSVLLRDLPYGDSERVFVLQQVDIRDGRVTDGVSPANVRDVAEATRTIQHVGVADGIHGLRLVRDGRAESLRAWVASEGFLEALGARPTLGRLFSPEEYRRGAEPVVVLAHGAWTDRFGADPSILGRDLVLDDVAHRVVGVMPAEFRYPSAADAWTARQPQPWDDAERGRPGMRGVALLRPGTTPSEAQDELDGVAQALRRAYPEQNEHLGFRVVSLRQHLLGDIQSPLVLLLGAVSMVLLVASANVAGLQLARGLARRREFAIRAALGAHRNRILRLCAVESLALALVGGLVGLGLAHLGVWSIEQLGPDHLPRIDEVRIDGAVMAFALAAAMGCAVLAGTVPALVASRTPPHLAFGGSARGATPGRRTTRLQDRLVVGEIAVALGLTIGAGLLLRSFERVLDNELGFGHEDLLAAQVWAYDDQHRAELGYFDVAAEALRAVPGVERVGVTSDLPLASDDQVLARTISVDVAVEGAAGDARQAANVSVIDGHYPTVMGIRLMSGRLFGPEDDATSRPVALVNAAFVGRYLQDRDPIGRTVTPSFRGTEPREIVGVLSDVRRYGFESEPEPEIYLHTLQLPFNGLTFVVRAAAEPASMVQVIHETLLETDPSQAVWAIQPLDALLVERVRRRRFNTTLLTVFACLALLLSAVGIYGLTAFAVEQRVGELGVRRALGSSTYGILRAILGGALKLSLCGVAIGLLGGAALARALQGMLFEVSPGDPLTFVGLALAVIGVSLLASLVAARKAVTIEPVVALTQPD